MAKGNKELKGKIDRETIIQDSKKNKRVIVFVIIFTVTIFVISGLYLLFEWERYQEIAASEALQLAKSAEALLHPENILELSGTSEDIMLPEYIRSKHSLERFVEVTDAIYFAYVLQEQKGKLVFLLDSEMPYSDDYSPPGQIFEEADDFVWSPFKKGKALITPPTADRWGTWVSALVAMKDPFTGEVIAVLGIDYSADEWYAALWKQMIPNFAVVFVVLMLYFSLVYIWIQRSRLRQLNKNLILEKAFYHSVFDQAPVGIAIVNDKSFISDQQFGLMNTNSMFLKILGRTSFELNQITWPEITFPDDLQADLEKFEQFKNGEIDGYEMEKRFLKPDGSIVWTFMKVASLIGLEGESSLHLCLIEDISSRMEMESTLKESERREGVVLSHLPGLAYRCNYDKDWTMRVVSKGCFNLTGYTSDNLLNNKDLSFNDLIVPEYRSSLWNEWSRVIAKKLPFKYEYEIITATGQRKWVLEMGQGIFDEQGEIEFLEGIILDISDKKEVENTLRYKNEHDEWTGLHNRNYLASLLESDAKIKDAFKSAIMTINLNTAQLLAANYGYRYIQNLMKKVAEAFCKDCTDRCMLFNTNENRFVFYLKNYKNTKELLKFSDKIEETLESIFMMDKISGGIGVFEIDKKHEINVDSILKKSLIASERAINIFDKDFKTCFYDEKLEDIVNREGELRQELYKIAMDENSTELFLQYQPILDVKTGLVSGFEALSRIRSKKLGLVSSVEFIPIAEQSKIIVPLGYKIILEAFRFLNNLEKHGYETMNVAINVSAIQLLNPDFTERLFEMISENGVKAENICLEITESVFFFDFEIVNNIIGKFKEAKIQISIDDFGTGYSSLAREKELNVDFLKMDKSFIDTLLEENPDESIAADIISMAHKLGHCVIAEGIEKDIQLQYLKDHGCDKIQGYLISKPLDDDAVFEFLKKYK